MPFFELSEVGTKPEPLLAQCGACGLFKTCQSPKMEPTGKGRQQVLIVSEAPGKEEDAQGAQLIGNSGQELEDVIEDLGFSMRRDCTLTNAIICRPPNNRAPTNQEIGYCRPNLKNTITHLTPRVIVLLGKVPVRSYMAKFWKQDTGGIKRWAGFQIPHQATNTWICPTFHPAYALRNAEKGNTIASNMMRSHLKAAFAHHERPWPDGPPNYRKCILSERNPRIAAKWIRDAVKRRKPLAFDYEANRLKPDYDNAAIVSCAVSDGKEAMAYPWQGEAIEATSRMLRSRVPMIGANIKFEERWTRRILGHGVRHWWWDTMLGAHWLDNRGKISSAKFQALVRLGFDKYDSLVEGCLKRVNPKTGLNHIHELSLESLLEYNGLDALLEYKVAVHQRKEQKARLRKTE